jgi:hypothetical protein
MKNHLQVYIRLVSANLTNNFAVAHFLLSMLLLVLKIAYLCVYMCVRVYKSVVLAA